jgi:molybdenum cofactor biosynthesis enzyme MoaA
MIRAETGRGTINLNTNAGRPHVLDRLLDAGLDGIRVSVNSFQEKCYNAYFRPKGYRFADVISSIDAALSADRFVSINYLNLPGFTDTPGEMEALFRFLEKHPIHFIQWRNLNFDPIRYWKAMNRVVCQGSSIGMKNLMEKIHNAFPRIRYGYFNPPKEKYRRFTGNQGRYIA